MQQVQIKKNAKTLRDMLSKRKMDYVDWYTRYDQASIEENRFIQNALDEVEDCRYELLDVFGDGNCLYYCLILMCRVKKLRVYTSGNMVTRTVVLKMRERLIDCYNKYFSNDEVKNKWFSHILMNILERN